MVSTEELNKSGDLHVRSATVSQPKASLGLLCGSGITGTSLTLKDIPSWLRALTWWCKGLVLEKAGCLFERRGRRIFLDFF